MRDTSGFGPATRREPRDAAPWHRGRHRRTRPTPGRPGRPGSARRAAPRGRRAAPKSEFGPHGLRSTFAAVVGAGSAARAAPGHHAWPQGSWALADRRSRRRRGAWRRAGPSRPPRRFRPSARRGPPGGGNGRGDGLEAFAGRPKGGTSAGMWSDHRWVEKLGCSAPPARRRGRLPRRPPERRHGSRKPPGRHRRRTGRGTSPAAAGSRWELRRGVVAPASTGRRGRVGAAGANGGGALSGGGAAATGSEGRSGTAWRREAAGAGPAAPRTRRTARHRAGGSVGVSLD